MPGAEKKDFLQRLAKAEDRDAAKKSSKTPAKKANRFREISVEVEDPVQPNSAASKKKSATKQQKQQPANKQPKASSASAPQSTGAKASSSSTPQPKPVGKADDSALDELRERMASGHMLTADELALLEAAAEEDEPPPTKAPPAKPTAGTSAPAKATKPSASSSSSEAAAADDDSALDELRERMASGHMLTADELALLEAAAEKEEAPSGKAAPPAKAAPAKAAPAKAAPAKAAPAKAAPAKAAPAKAAPAKATKTAAPAKATKVLAPAAAPKKAGKAASLPGQAAKQQVAKSGPSGGRARVAGTGEASSSSADEKMPSWRDFRGALGQVSIDELRDKMATGHMLTGTFSPAPMRPACL